MEIQVRNSERSAFLQCRWKWWGSYVINRKVKREQTALRFGDLIHQSLEAFYKKGVVRGPKPAVTFRKLYQEQIEAADAFGLARSDSEWRDAEELGISMMEAYYEEYGKDDLYKVLACEQQFSAPIMDESGVLPLTVIGKPVMYVGKMDGVWQNRSNKNILICDHKTTAKISTSMLYMDEQASSYWTYGVDWLVAQGILKDASELRGMLYNFMRKAKPDERERNELGQCLNKNGTVSKQQPPKLFDRHTVWRDETDRSHIRQRIAQQVAEMQRARAGDMAIYKSPGLFNMNCNTCSFRDICELHETGSDWQEMMKLTTEKYDPYEDHKKETTNKQRTKQKTDRKQDEK